LLSKPFETYDINFTARGSLPRGKVKRRVFLYKEPPPKYMRDESMLSHRFCVYPSKTEAPSLTQEAPYESWERFTAFLFFLKGLSAYMEGAQPGHI